MNQFDKDISDSLSGWKITLSPVKKQIMYIFLGFITVFTLSLLLSANIIELLKEKTSAVSDFIQTSPEEAFLSSVKIAFFTGFYTAIPVLIYLIGKLNIKDMTPNKKKELMKNSLYSSGMIIIGILFAYYVIIPVQLMFFLGMNVNIAENSFNIFDYVSFCLGSILLSCLCFQLLLVYILAKKKKFIPAKFMTINPKYIFITGAILAALVLLPLKILSFIFISGSIVLFYKLAVSITKKYNSP